MTRKIFDIDDELLDMTGPDISEDDSDDVDDEQREMFEHFRLELDKGQTPMRVDKYMATHLASCVPEMSFPLSCRTRGEDWKYSRRTFHWT